MKKLILLAGVAALAACADNANDEAAEDNAEAVDMAAENETMEEAMLAPDGGPVAGTYEVTDADGNKSTTTINEDMTYTRTVDGEVQGQGTVTMQDGDTACFDDMSDDEGPVCYDSVIDADGTWTSTGPDGTATVVRVET